MFTEFWMIRCAISLKKFSNFSHFILFDTPFWLILVYFLSLHCMSTVTLDGGGPHLMLLVCFFSWHITKLSACTSFDVDYRRLSLLWNVMAITGSCGVDALLGPRGLQIHSEQISMCCTNLKMFLQAS